MLDADLQRFESGINQTRAGMRLRLAMHEASIAIAQIERLMQLNGPRGKQAIEGWRRAYIAASDRGSLAIDELWDVNAWPTDAARNHNYEWRPVKR